MFLAGLKEAPIIFPLFYSSVHNIWLSGPAVALRRGAERRHERKWEGGVPESWTNRGKCRCHRHLPRPLPVYDCVLQRPLRFITAQYVVLRSGARPVLRFSSPTTTSCLNANRPKAPIA